MGNTLLLTDVDQGLTPIEKTGKDENGSAAFHVSAFFYPNLHQSAIWTGYPHNHD